MKTKKIFTILFVILVGATTLSYAEKSADEKAAKEVQEETQDLIDASGNYTAAQKAEAIEKTQSTLDRLDQRIDVLEDKIDDSWDEMSEEAQERTRDTLRTLRKQRIKVAEKFGSLKDSSSEAWDKMKKGFVDAYKELTSAWDESLKEFDPQQ